MKKNILFILTKHTKNRAKGKGNRNPESILRNIDPGIANDCKLITVKVNIVHVILSYVIS